MEGSIVPLDFAARCLLLCPIERECVRERERETGKLLDFVRSTSLYISSHLIGTLNQNTCMRTITCIGSYPVGAFNRILD